MKLVEAGYGSALSKSVLVYSNVGGDRQYVGRQINRIMSGSDECNEENKR